VDKSRAGFPKESQLLARLGFPTESKWPKAADLEIGALKLISPSTGAGRRGGASTPNEGRPARSWSTYPPAPPGQASQWRTYRRVTEHLAPDQHPNSGGCVQNVLPFSLTFIGAEKYSSAPCPPRRSDLKKGFSSAANHSPLRRRRTRSCIRVGGWRKLDSW
jgi:hypothetical protein